MRASALLPLVSLITLVHCAPLSPDTVATDAYGANRDAVKSSNGNVYADPWISSPADFKSLPVGICLIATGQVPNSKFKSPDGKEHKADAYGRVFRDDCVPAQPEGEAEDPIFRPGLGSVQAAQPGEDNDDGDNDGDDASFPPSGDDLPPNYGDDDGENGPSDDGFPSGDAPYPIDDEEPYPEDSDNAPQPSNDDNNSTPSANEPASTPSNSADEPASPTDNTTPAPSSDGDDGNYDGGFFPVSNGRVAAAAPTSGPTDAPEPFSGSLPLPSLSMPSMSGGVPRIQPSGIPRPGSPSLGMPSTPNKTFPRPAVAAGIKASMNGCADGCKDC